MHNHHTAIITSILQQHFQTADWIIAPPKDGQQKASFIARHADLRVFIKLDMPVAALQRLGDIGAAPRALAGGMVEDTTYVVQEYIEGIYPDWRWFAAHLPTLARFLRRYHDDQPLTALLAAGSTPGYAAHIAADLAKLEAQFRLLESDELHTIEIETAFHRLEGWSKQLQPAILVPIHPDPNTKNILLRDTGGDIQSTGDDALVMVDWDDIQLSDPMRDAGLLLWWYVPHAQWSEFFDAYGVVIDEAIIEKIYWWVARTSFAVALWHVERRYDCQAFLQDFRAALHMESNPHAVFG